MHYYSMELSYQKEHHLYLSSWFFMRVHLIYKARIDMIFLLINSYDPFNFFSWNVALIVHTECKRLFVTI